MEVTFVSKYRLMQEGYKVTDLQVVYVDSILNYACNECKLGKYKTREILLRAKENSENDFNRVYKNIIKQLEGLPIPYARLQRVAIQLIEEWDALMETFAPEQPEEGIDIIEMFEKGDDNPC